jgi:pimeloyl-ACP methyl ester carboxylesterase
VTSALVFLHGFAFDARQWRRQVEAFGKDHRVITIDLPGFGPQARDLGDVRPGAELARALTAAKVDAAHIVGSSYGAAVAIDFALQFPTRVASLTLAAPLLLGRRTGIEAWSRCVSLANEGDRATAIEVWLDDPLFEGLRRNEELFEEARIIALDYGGGHWTGKITSRWSDPDPVRRLPSIQAPALVVSGESDLPSFMLMAETYAKAIPNARREIIRGAGHNVNMERPAEFNALLRDFLKSL